MDVQAPPPQLAAGRGACDIVAMDYSENIGRLKPSATIAVSTLAKKLAREGRDIINLSAGEPDFPTPAWVAERGSQAILEGQTRYTPAAGTPELRAAVADYLASGTQHTPEPARVVVTAGAKQALFNACFSLFGPRDRVLIGSPYWTSYPEIVNLARAEPVPVWGPEERDFLLRAEDLEGVWTPDAKGLILSTPSNPSGAVYTLEDLKEIAQWAKTRSVVLICDEIYREIYFGDDRATAPGLLDLPEDMLGELVLVNGLSKSFAMTGWRLGFSYASEDLSKKMAALQSHVSSNAATPSQAAALHALTHPELAAASHREMVEAFRRRRDLVMGMMDQLLPDCSYVRPGGAFYLYFRIDASFEGDVASSEAVCTRILEESGVAVVPGAAFGDDRYARMSFASSDEQLVEGVQRMARVLGARRASV